MVRRDVQWASRQNKKPAYVVSSRATEASAAVLHVRRARVRIRAADITNRALRVALESPLFPDARGDLPLEFAHLRLELADHINHTLTQTKTSQMEENVWTRGKE